MLLLICGSPLFSQNIQTIKMEELVNRYRQAPGVVVINFWSTWCKPCIEEIPGFLKVAEKYKNDSVQLWLVSQDTRSLFESGQLKNWIAKRKWQANWYWLNETDADYYCPLVDVSWSGVIPATVVIHPKKTYYRFVEESMKPEQLEALVKEALQ